MGVRQTNMVEVAERFGRLLRSVVPAFEQRIHWVIGDSPPAEAIRDQELITYSFQGGQFDYPNQVGGPIVDWHGSVRVCVWASNYSDVNGASSQLLVGTPHGLYRMEQKLLLMCGSNLEDGDPLDLILLDGIKALNDDVSHQASSDAWQDKFTAVLSVTFSIDFQWDLTSDD